MGKGGGQPSGGSTSATTTTTTGAGTRTDVTLKLPQLQNFCKRDPPGYKDDYDAQIRRLRSECEILSLSPNSEPSDRLSELIQFAAAVSSSSYRGEESDSIADLLIGLLVGGSSDGGGAGVGGGSSSSASGAIDSPAAAALHLHRDVRKSCVSALILMRNKGAIEPIRLLELFFRLMSVVPDKSLRELLYRHVVNDVRNVNKKGRRDEKVNRTVQAFLHRIISSAAREEGRGECATAAGGEDSASDVAARRGTDMVCELYRRGVWTDERTVSILASAVEHPNVGVSCRAMRFFLNVEEKMAEDQRREEEDAWHGVNSIDFHQHSRKTKKRKKQIGKQVKNRQKQQQRRENAERMEAAADRGVEASKKLYPAIELLHDPQGLAESVFRRVKGNGSSSKYKFEQRLLMINFVTRLVGNHELLLLPLYPFLQRYMGGHQRDVTAILAHSVQACHEYVPPDEISAVLKTIVSNFVTERCSGEQMAVGINACRAICSRVPSVLSVEDRDDDAGDAGSAVLDAEAFARDLAAYAKHRDRSVSVAGRGWTNFVREIHPSLLAGKDRGSRGSALHRAGEKPLRYGERRVASGVEGADLLVEYERKKEERARRNAERRARGRESESDGDDDDDSDGIREEKMNDVVSSEDEDGEWVDVDRKGGSDDESDEDSGEWAEADEESDSDDSADDRRQGDDADDDVAPTLVVVNEAGGKAVAEDDDAEAPTDEGVVDDADDVSKLSPEERAKIRQRVSSTRVFTASDFVKMRKLVEREERIKRDPRAAAKRKRDLARGGGFEELSDDDDGDADSEDDAIRVAGSVNPGDIMAEAKRKRQSKAEKLEKIIAGRSKFEAKERDGGSTNTEKKRKKHFVMTKFSFATRKKLSGKETARGATKKRGKASNRDAKKRRRKM